MVPWSPRTTVPSGAVLDACAVALAPAADHQDLARVAIGLHDLEIDEPVVALHAARSCAERIDQLGRPLRRDPES